MGDINMPDLKRCPFCNGFAQPALENRLLLGGADKWYHKIRCKVCGAQTGLWETYELAVKHWNSRVEQTCHHAVTERGEACCSNCGEPDEWWLFYEDLNYCPNCGARVVSEEEEGHMVADAIRRLEKVLGE